MPANKQAGIKNATPSAAYNKELNKELKTIPINETKASAKKAIITILLSLLNSPIEAKTNDNTESTAMTPVMVSGLSKLNINVAINIHDERRNKTPDAIANGFAAAHFLSA